MTAFTDLALKLIRLFEPEAAHRLTVRTLAAGLGKSSTLPLDPSLETTVFGLRFPTPIGLAAGFDKSGEAIGACLRLGFGFVEVGTITPRAQSGNPKPRLFRLSVDRAVINRMGFNNAGAEAATARLRKAQVAGLPGIVGVNIGKNKNCEDDAADYAAAARLLAPVADYLTINVSSPNTPDLRSLQAPDRLADLIASVRGAATETGAPPPILVKIAPDLGPEDVTDIVAVAHQESVSGLIVSNTTVSRPPGLIDPRRDEAGGLSGAPLFDLSTEMLRQIYVSCNGTIPLIGVGGIGSAEQAYVKIRAGASLVQLYSALVYQGPALIPRITQGLSDLLAADGFANITDAVGADAHR